MAQLTYKVPKTNLMVWYKEQEDKMNAVRAIRVKIGNVSASLITNWLLGYSEPKRTEQIDALEEITGISREMLFKYESDEQN